MIQTVNNVTPNFTDIIYDWDAKFFVLHLLTFEKICRDFNSKSKTKALYYYQFLF